MAVHRRAFVARSAALAASAAGMAGAQAVPRLNPGPSGGASAVITWNRALTGAIATTAMQAPVAARACAMTHEAIYNAWAAYHPVAAFTLPGMRKRDPSEYVINAWNTLAMCYAAYGVLVNLFPTQKASFDSLLASSLSAAAAGQPLGLAARQVGELAANALLQVRRSDGSNQQGDLAPGAYADWTGYAPINTPDVIVDPTRWQPLRLPTADGGTTVQTFLTPHWGQVQPFALASGSMYRPSMGWLAPTEGEMAELIAYSAALDDYTKALVDFWALNPGSVSPPGLWMQFCEQVSARDGNTLEMDVKLFFAAAQAVFDAGIAAWDAKRAWDSVRPITAIRFYKKGKKFKSWGGAGKGTQEIDGEEWRPFQRPTSITPPFAEYVSGHSTFSAAAAAAMAAVRGSDSTLLTGAILANSLRVDPGYPTVTVNFSYTSLSTAADSAGISRRVGGIHFEQGDLAGRALGKRVGQTVAARCLALYNGQQA